MNQPPNSKQNVSSNTTKIILIVIFLAILLLAFGILVGLVLRSGDFQLPLFASHITPAPSPQCVEPTLTLGTTKFRMDSVTREANSFPDIPPRKQDIAYWVEGTTVNYVFGLSP